MLDQKRRLLRRQILNLFQSFIHLPHVQSLLYCEIIIQFRQPRALSASLYNSIHSQILRVGLEVTGQAWF